MAESMLDERNTKASGNPEAGKAGEETSTRIENIEICSNAMRLAVKENLSSVILEPTPGKGWQYTRAGCLIAQNQEISVLIAKSKGATYAICVPGKDGNWQCSIIDNGELIKSIQARL